MEVMENREVHVGVVRMTMLTGLTCRWGNTQRYGDLSTTKPLDVAVAVEAGLGLGHNLPHVGFDKRTCEGLCDGPAQPKEPQVPDRTSGPPCQLGVVFSGVSVASVEGHRPTPAFKHAVQGRRGRIKHVGRLVDVEANGSKLFHV